MEYCTRVGRRRQVDALKAMMLSERGVAGASVAQIALAHDLKANLVHKWPGKLEAPGSVSGHRN